MLSRQPGSRIGWTGESGMDCNRRAKEMFHTDSKLEFDDQPDHVKNAWIFAARNDERISSELCWNLKMEINDE